MAYLSLFASRHSPVAQSGTAPGGIALLRLSPLLFWLRYYGDCVRGVMQLFAFARSLMPVADREDWLITSLSLFIMFELKLNYQLKPNCIIRERDEH